MSMLQKFRANYNMGLFLSSSLLTLSTFNFAFDNQGFAQTQAMTQFLAVFGDLQPNGTYAFSTSFTSLFNSESSPATGREA